MSKVIHTVPGGFVINENFDQYRRDIADQTRYGKGVIESSGIIMLPYKKGIWPFRKNMVKACFWAIIKPDNV